MIRVILSSCQLIFTWLLKTSRLFSSRVKKCKILLILPHSTSQMSGFTRPHTAPQMTLMYTTSGLFILRNISCTMYSCCCCKSLAQWPIMPYIGQKVKIELNFWLLYSLAHEGIPYSCSIFTKSMKLNGHFEFALQSNHGYFFLKWPSKYCLIHFYIYKRCVSMTGATIILG